MVHFDLYEEYHARIQNEIVGKTVNGITITGQSNHFLERVFGTMIDPEKFKKGEIVRRSGVAIEDIIDTALHGKARFAKQENKDGKIRRSVKIVGENCVVTINPDTGVLIQTNPN